MNSFILITKNPKQQKDYLEKFIKTHAVSLFDQTIIDEKGSIGIEIIRKLQENLFFKPYKGDNKIIVINHAENLTIEAQNALLKILEEPPLFVYIFLLTTTQEAFLPTVISRCKIVEFTQQKNKSLANDSPEALALLKALEENLQTITSGIIGEKLALAETLAADKEKLSEWFENMAIFLREKLHKNIDSQQESLKYTMLLSALQEAYKTYTTTNVNPRVILEHTFLLKTN